MIQDWVGAGLITSSQATAIRDFERQRADQPRPEAAPRDEVAPARRAGRLDVGSIVMYIGAFLILFALTIFIGSAWDDMSRFAQFAWALVAVGGLWSLGWLVRSRLSAVTGGNLLIFAGTGAVPLLVYTVQRLAGWWPDDSARDYEDFYDRILAVWIVMELVSILVALAVIVRIRFPLIMLLIGFWTWFLSMDLARWISGDEKWRWHEREHWIGAALGVVLAGAAAYLFWTGRRPYGMWLALFANLVWYGHLGSLALDHEATVARLLFPLLAIVAIIASVWLQARVYLVFGALALYSWVAYLVFDVFGSGLGVTFALVVIGVFIVLTGVLYQRAIEPWLEERLRFSM